jgi:large subunit ribosomal protein L13
MNEKIVIDGENCLLGRVASFAAKQALLGKEVAVINCEKIVVSGKPRSVILEYREDRQRGGASLKGPFFPKQPERIVKRTIRGMLPYKKGNGALAFKRVKCYVGATEELLKNAKKVEGSEKKLKVIALSKLSKEI